MFSSQDTLDTGDNSGPLDEIEFWRNRCVDLAGISKQLDNTGVKRVTMILELAKSSYTAPFLRLAGQIKVFMVIFVILVICILVLHVCISMGMFMLFVITCVCNYE